MAGAGGLKPFARTLPCWQVLVLGSSRSWGGQGLPGMAASSRPQPPCSMCLVGGLEPGPFLVPLLKGQAQGPCPYIPSGSLS